MGGPPHTYTLVHPNIMALAAREVRIAAGDNHIIGVERNLIVDPQSGVAAQVENVTVAVDMGDGNIAIAKQQRIAGIRTAPSAGVSD